MTFVFRKSQSHWMASQGPMASLSLTNLWSKPNGVGFDKTPWCIMKTETCAYDSQILMETCIQVIFQLPWKKLSMEIKHLFQFLRYIKFGSNYDWGWPLSCLSSAITLIKYCFWHISLCGGLKIEVDDYWFSLIFFIFIDSVSYILSTDCWECLVLIKSNSCQFRDLLPFVVCHYSIAKQKLLYCCYFYLFN